MNQSMIPQSVRPEASPAASNDPLASFLTRAAHYLLVITGGVLPLIFIPTPNAPFEFTKVLFVATGAFLALILWTLAVLRAGSFSLPRSVPLLLLWGVAATAALSALLSGDVRDAFIGDAFGIHTAAFVALLALVATVWAIVGVTKAHIMQLYMLFAASTLILVLFHIVRFFAGTDALSFGVFTSSVATPIGGWNDLALFLGLSIILSLIALLQLPLSRWGRVLFAGVIVAALLLLAVINFQAVWVVVGLVALAFLVYTLRRYQTPSSSEGGRAAGRGHSGYLVSFGASLLVCGVSLTLFLGGTSLGGWINNLTNISYVEVRPSFEATINIARSVYADNAFLGIGTNRFIDAWRLYRDPAINTTVFWNTNFNGGSGYIPTFFVTTGLLGVIAWLAFLVVFVVFGVRLLLTSPPHDRVWHFIATSAFGGALYVWLMSFLYVPGATLLLIGALCTGLTIVASSQLRTLPSFTVSELHHSRFGFVLTLATIVVIVGSVSALYGIGRHYAGVYTFNKSVTSIEEGVPLENIEAQVVRAYELSFDDRFAQRLAQYQIARINTLLGIAEPADAQRQEFQLAITNGISAAQRAIESDSTNPENWGVLGNLYSVLAGAGVEGAADRAREAFDAASERDPYNPLWYLARAQLAAQAGDRVVARSFAQQAVELKPNYSDGLFFIAQLDIAEGNVAGAIDAVRAIISFEPQNPARFYQLGVLELSRNNAEAAVAALETAVALSSEFSNARYFLAIAYDAVGRADAARAQLQEVQMRNPESQEVRALLERLDNGEPLSGRQEGALPPAEEAVALPDALGDVTVEENPETPFVAPVNTVPAETDQSR